LYFRAVLRANFILHQDFSKIHETRTKGDNLTFIFNWVEVYSTKSWTCWINFIRFLKYWEVLFNCTSALEVRKSAIAFIKSMLQSSVWRGIDKFVKYWTFEFNDDTDLQSRSLTKLYHIILYKRTHRLSGIRTYNFSGDGHRLHM
jgi:hypothetical protein